MKTLLLAVCIALSLSTAFASERAAVDVQLTNNQLSHLVTQAVAQTQQNMNQAMVQQIAKHKVTLDEAVIANTAFTELARHKFVESTIEVNE